MTIREDLDHLKHIDSYKRLVSYIEQYYDQAITDLVTQPPDCQPTLVGKVAAYKELLELMKS